MDADDPFDWSLDRVIQEVCQSDSPSWANGADLKPIPNPEFLEKALKDNDIDGDNLLALEEKDIRDDLKITSFGQRRALSSRITHLRSLSTKYQACLNRMSMTALVTPRLSGASVKSHNRSPSYAGSWLHPSVEVNKNEGNAMNFENHNQMKQLVDINILKRKWPEVAELSNVHTDYTTTAFTSEAHGSRANTRMTSETRPTTNNTGLPHSTTSNPVRLADSLKTPPNHQSFLNDIDSALDQELSLDPPTRNSSPATANSNAVIASLEERAVKPKKRAVLVPVANRPVGLTQFGGADLDNANESESRLGQLTVLGDRTPDKSNERHSKHRRLTAASSAAILPIATPTVTSKVVSKKIRKDRVPYHKTKPFATEDDADTVDADTEFVFSGSVKNAGRYRHEARSVKPYFASDIEVEADALQKSGLFNTTTQSGVQSLRHGGAQDEPTVINSHPDLSPELMLILQKYPMAEHDSGLPVYGESDHEEIDTVTDESESEKVSPPDASKKLGTAEIDSIIDEYIRQLTSEWHQHQSAKAQVKAHTKWRAAAKNRIIHSKMLHDCISQRSDASKRIHKFREGIHFSEWSKAEDVRQQCAALEVSVHNLELYTLYVKVLSSENEPYKPQQTKPRRPQKPRQRKVLPDGDEEIGTESDNSDFIDDSEIVPGESSSDWRPQFTTMPKDKNKDQAPVMNKKGKLPSDDFEGDSSDFERSPRRPATSYSKEGRSEDVPIDLTRSDSPPLPDEADNFEVHTPPLNDAPADFEFSKRSKDSGRELTAAKGTSISETALSDDDEKTVIMDVKRVLDLDWNAIKPQDEENPIDSRLSLAKAVYDMSINDVKYLIDYVKSFQKNDDIAEVLQCGLEAANDLEEEIADVDKKNQGNATSLTNLLIIYATGCYIDDEGPSEHDVDEARGILEDGFIDFIQLTKTLLRNYITYVDSKHTASDAAPTSMLADRPDRSGVKQLKSATTLTPTKIRMRKVVQDKNVLRQQRDDQRKAEEQEAKRARLLANASARGIGDKELSVAININEPLVYLDSHIASRIKPHQVDGVRFMWREIVENENAQGCLLAHTMGLGKTMQVISLLSSIAQCNASVDPAMNSHIPEHLQRLRVMILCPLALIENWSEEFPIWLPDPLMLGVIWKIDKDVKHPEITIHRWYQEGGVLILGYEKFQRFVIPPKKPGTSSEPPGERTRYLLEGPDIVIADEAHRLKNAKSLVNRAAQQFLTKSRIALTGSPLNNHLEEYHTMINWVSPSYLGSMIQFKAKYVEPINRGLYSESTGWERKASMKKLHVLKRIIAPKINRADITAISKDLPPKTEFFLTIPLTLEQEAAYKLYVRELRNRSSNNLDNAKLWSWLSVLSLLLNHPSCFVSKLKQREMSKKQAEVDARKAEKAESDDDGYESAAFATSPDKINVAEQPILEGAMQKVMDVFTEAQVLYRMENPSLSYKTVLVKRILEEAIKVNDKSLVFTKSIPTLDYYENMVREMGIGYKRIDGSSAGASKINRQKVVAEFNTSPSIQVLLISTRAGGLGLNIQAANRVIINDFDFNPAWEEQAVGRAYRLGQKKPVFVYRFLMGGTFEELIHNTAVFKTQLFTRVVDAKNVVSQAAKKPGDFLFDPKHVPQQDFSDCLGKDRDVLDRVLHTVDFVRNIFLTETFYQDDEEELNEQELKEADEELELERLERDNPVEYAKRIQELKSKQSQANNQFHDKTNGRPTAAGNKQTATANEPFPGLSHFVNLSIPNPNMMVPARTMSVPNASMSTPSPILTAPTRNMPVPTANLSIPNRNMSVPATNMSIANRNYSFSARNMSLPAPDHSRLTRNSMMTNRQSMSAQMPRVTAFGDDFASHAHMTQNSIRANRQSMSARMPSITAFSDDFVPSTRHSAQPMQQLSGFLDDQDMGRYPPTPYTPDAFAVLDNDPLQDPSYFTVSGMNTGFDRDVFMPDETGADNLVSDAAFVGDQFGTSMTQNNTAAQPMQNQRSHSNGQWLEQYAPPYNNFGGGNEKADSASGCRPQ